ncbi:MAG: PDZ domain-containing protein [Rhodospirillales bacterium]|nr:PDZ domain-containing protein [Rhodospirillales bacterium]
MGRFRLLFPSSLLLTLALAGCVPAYQYEPLTVTALDQGQARALIIEAAGHWRDTGIQVRKDETYRIETQGKWSASPLCGEVDAAGLINEHLLCMKGIFAQSFPDPQAPVAALVGKIGPEGRSFAVGGTRGFIADRDGTLFLRMNDPDDFSGDNTGRIEVAVQRYGEGVSASPFQASGPAPRPAQQQQAQQGASYPKKQASRSDTPASILTAAAEQSYDLASTAQTQSAIIPASGVYDLDGKSTFNILDAVEFHPDSGGIVLIGHYDHRFGARRIPYMQHLATLLDHPDPEFSLEWTDQSERQVNAFLNRMDDMEEMRNLDAVSGSWLDPNGLPTAQGRTMLPLLGVKPTKNGRAPGRLGMTTSIYTELDGVRVDEVDPGSAAERAGLQVGDVLNFIDGWEVIHPGDTLRAVSFAGAGATVNVSGSRNGEHLSLNPVLDSSDADPWQHVTRYDIAAQMFRQIDMNKAANVLEALEKASRLINTPVGPRLPFIMFTATETWDTYEYVMNAQNSGSMDVPEAQRQMQRAVVEGVEDAFRLNPGTLTVHFDNAMYQGMTSSQAFTEAMAYMDAEIEPLLKDMLRTLLHRNDEIVLPVTAVEHNLGARPEVEPRYYDLPSDSLLARAMFEADYLGKSFLFNPELAERIPGYMTDYQYDVTYGEASNATTTRHMWFSIDAVATKEDGNGKRLLLGEPRMRFNFRDDTPGASQFRDGGYGALLTSLYEPLSMEYPALHELSEAAKLARAAQWMRGKSSSFRLPAEGRAKWSPPARFPGIVNLIWSPQNVQVTMVAAGGASLRVPPIGPSGPVVPVLPYPQPGGEAVRLDAKEIDSLVVMPQPFNNQTLGRVLKKKTEVPFPLRLGEATRATKGERTAVKLMAPPKDSSCDLTQTQELNNDLATARDVARRLSVVENAINAISNKNPDRQQAYAEFENELNTARDEFVAAGIGLLTQHMSDAYDEVGKTVKGTQLEELYQGAAMMKEAQSGLDDMSEKLSKLRLAYDLAKADDIESREKVVGELTDLIKDMLGEAKILGNNPTRKAMKMALGTLNKAQALKDVMDMAAPIVTMGKVAYMLKKTSAETDKDLARLNETLLPAQRRLSDRLDEAMKTPNVQQWLEGKSRGICAAQG